MKARSVSILFSAVFLLCNSASADICQLINVDKIDLIRSQLIGLTVQEEGPDSKPVKIADVLEQGNGTFLNGVEYSGIQIQGTQGEMIMDADLGHLDLVCSRKKVDNLAGAMKNSGLLCAEKPFDANIPASTLNLDCRKVNSGS